MHHIFVYICITGCITLTDKDNGHSQSLMCSFASLLEATKSLSSEEAETISTELEKLDQAKSDSIDAAVFSALDQAEREKREAHRLEEVERLLSQNGDLDQDQRDRIMAEYKETSQNIERQISEQRNNQVRTNLCKKEKRICLW